MTSEAGMMVGISAPIQRLLTWDLENIFNLRSDNIYPMLLKIINFIGQVLSLSPLLSLF